MNLDENNEMHYQDKLRELWETCDEIRENQDKVAELLQKSQEFAKFFSTKPRRFSLYVSLLTGKGHYLLAAYLEKELSKRNLSIQAVFLDKKAVLEEQLGHTENVNSFNAAKKKRDISVLVTVILVCFKDTLDPRVKKAIAGIHEAYLGYARLALKSLDVEKFSEIDGDLVNNLRILSWDLGADIVLECEEFINNHRLNKRESTPDTDDDFDLLKSHGLKLKTLEDVYNETLNQLKEVMKKMEERGIPFKRDYVLQLQLMTYGEKKAVVEDILTTVFAAALRHNESTDEYKDIREEVDHILDQIKAITGVTVETVERHCILISIRCSSSLGLLKLIEYVESTFFQEMLYKLSTVLIASFEEVLVVTGNFNFETLHGLANYLSYCFEKEHEQGGLTLPISCSSVEGVNQVLRLMAADTAKHSVKNVAEQLSKRVGDKVTLQVKFPDLEQCFGVTEDNVNYLSTPHIETSHYDPANDTNDKDTSPTVRSERFEGCVIYKKSLTVIKQELTLNEMSEEMRPMFIKEKKDFFNWSSATIAIRETIGALHGYIKTAAEEELKKWTDEERLHFKIFIGHIKSDSGRNLYSRNSLKCREQSCIDTFERLCYMRSMQNKPLQLHIQPPRRPNNIFLRLFASPPKLQHPDWWILLTFFLPGDEKNDTTLETCKLTSLCDLFKHCNLFGHLLKNLRMFDEIIRIRNKLMHSATFEITSQEKTYYIGTMKQFVEYLESERVKSGWAEISQIQNAQTYLKQREQSNEDPSPKYGELQEALKKKSDEIQKDMETIDSELSQMLEKLKAAADENLKIFDQIIWTDDTLKGLAEGIVLGAEEGAKAVGGGTRTRQMGYFTGAAGAAGAGLYDKKSQQSSTFKANMGNELSLWRIEDKQKCQPIHGEILNSFASIALSLKYTTDLVHEIVDKTMKAEYDSWPEDIRDGFMNFMEKADQVEYIDRRKRQEDGKAWKLNYNDKTAEKILGTIVSLHTNPTSEHFNWKSDDNSAAQPYWVLTKIFMPYGNELSAGVGSSDPLSILTLLKNCILFKDFDEEEIDKVIDARNLLMHSVPQYISTQIKKDCLNAMIKFVQLPPLKLVSGRKNLCIQLERVRDGDVVVCDELPALRKHFEKWLPRLSESEILETANDIKGNLKSTLETILTAQNNEKKKQEKKQRLETVGGVVGVISTGATTGAAGGGVSALAVAAVGAVAVGVGATVAAPAIIAGGVLVAGVTGVSTVVGAIIGWTGGSAGGRAVGKNIRE